MICWIVVPIKAPAACKTRLRAALPDQARVALVRRMLHHVHATALRVAEVDRVLLLGPERHGLPARTPLLADPGGGLNAALAAAREAALAAGVGRLVLVSADLPCVTAADLRRLARAPAGTIGIAPDRAGRGTNALSLPLPAAGGFRFAYGAGSLAAHGREAGRLGLPVDVMTSATLGDDIDEPADLAGLTADLERGATTGM